MAPASEPLPLKRTAVFGSTRLTQQLLEYLEGLARPRFVLGLSAPALADKANGLDLSELCRTRRIPHSVDDDWSLVAQRLESLEIEVVLAFGESRLIPEEITSRYLVIGNHGAVLPDVQGGASLVWGRMADLGTWGVSIFQLIERVDSGPVLATRRFDYPPDVSMRTFVELADNETLEAFRAVVDGGLEPGSNAPYARRVANGADSHAAVAEMLDALSDGTPIYMPRRTPAESALDPTWPSDFQRVFKLANDAPYPRWRA